MTKLTHKAAGTFAIAPTPFHDDGRIDEKSIDRLTDFYAEVGCDGVTVLGILGEAPKLDATEAEQVAIRFVKRAKNMQIIVGVSAPGFATMRSLAQKSMDAGAAGVMIAPPPHLRTDDQITGYFKQAQEAIGDDIPWVLQDYPLTLTVVFTPAVIRKIVMDSPSCVMLKHEDWPGLEKISALRAFQKDVTELLEFLGKNSFRSTELNPGNPETSGWVFFNANSKWISDWKKQEDFVLRLPLDEKIFEFPFRLPPKQGELLLRHRE